MNKKAIIVLLPIICTIITAVSLTNCTNPGKEKTLQNNDTIPLTKHWERAIHNQTVPEGLVSLSAKECGDCHQEIYEEWQQSIHAIAFQDLQFQAEWKKDNVYVCLNCHTPLQNQQEFIVTGLLNGDYQTPVKIPNPNFDKELQLESITCAVCHIRNGNVIGINDSSNAPHKTVRDVEFLSEKICTSCHNVVDELNPMLVCTFETGDEWQTTLAYTEGNNCITCHMPEIAREIVEGFGIKKSHFHHFPGSGIPKFFDMEAKGLKGLEIKTGSIKDKYTVGEKINYSLLVKNSYTGHSVPSGDPERFILISFLLKDVNEKVMSEKQYRIGEEWQWYPVAKKLYDNNLQPTEEREYIFEFEFLKKGKLTLTAEITKHRMNKENAEYMGILKDYPLSIIVWKKEYDIVIN